MRVRAHSHAFIDTLEPIADDEEDYVKNVQVIAEGSHLQRLTKVSTAEGEDWVYFSGKWAARPDGDHPLVGIVTDADIVAWRVVDNKVTRFYLAGGSYGRVESNGRLLPIPLLPLIKPDLRFSRIRLSCKFLHKRYKPNCCRCW